MVSLLVEGGWFHCYRKVSRNRSPDPGLVPTSRVALPPARAFVYALFREVRCVSARAVWVGSGCIIFMPRRRVYRCRERRVW